MTFNRSRTIQVATVLVLLLAITGVVRGPTFFWSVINWDESVYLLVARSVLDGHAMYTEIWDHKQPLNGWLFALSQLAFGNSVAAIRVLACVAVTLTALGLFLAARSTFPERSAGPAAAAILYILFSISSGGFATNTEILFAPFTTAAAAIVLPWWVVREATDGPRTSTCFAAGLVLGLATLVKLVAVYDAAFVAGLVFATSSATWRHAHLPGLQLRRVLLRLVAIGGGCAAPWLLVALYFWFAGAFDEFVFANFVFNRRYLAQLPPFVADNLWLVFRRLLIDENGLLWAGLPIGVAMVVVNPPWLGESNRRLLAAGVVWALLGTVAALSMRRLYLHYYLQPTPALALISGALLSLFWTRTSRLPAAAKALLVMVLLVPQGQRIAERWRQPDETGDLPATIARFIGDRLQAGEIIYVANYQPVLYYLTGSSSPTRWAMPQFLVSPVYRELLGIDLEDELASIFSRNPRYVVLQPRDSGLVDPEFYRLLINRYLAPHYDLEVEIGGVAIFRRRPAASPEEPRAAS